MSKLTVLNSELHTLVDIEENMESLEETLQNYLSR